MRRYFGTRSSLASLAFGAALITGFAGCPAGVRAAPVETAGTPTDEHCAGKGGRAAVSALEAARQRQRSPALASVDRTGFGWSCREASPGNASAIADAGQHGAFFRPNRMVAIATTPYDGAWRRVTSAPLSRVEAGAFLGNGDTGSGREALVEFVNRRVNTRIAYAPDVLVRGRADYWSDARSTLRRASGDCEDLAIAKMQLLAALGFPTDSLYLVIAHDQAVRADHAVLVAAVGGKFLVLDNRSDALVDVSEVRDMRAIVSLSGSHRFLHGV